MRITVVTLFPEAFGSFLRAGLLSKAISGGHLQVAFVSPRDHTTDKHRSVDDTPYGGGGGMVLMPGPTVAAIEAADRGERAHRVLMTPQGTPLRQRHVERYAELSALTLVCGRYEGVDERIRHHVDEEVSLGDFVLLGGEVAAMAIIEGTARLLPGVLGNATSAVHESHVEGLLEHPHYTRPAESRGEGVPDVLLSGDHAAIARWRRKESLRRTRRRRPDLLERAPLNDDDRALLAELEAEPEDGEP